MTTLDYHRFYDACRSHGLRLRLGVFLEGVEPTREPIHSKDTPAPKLTFRLSVRDGETLCCAGDLGESIHAPETPASLLRMAVVLVGQGRARERDFKL